MKTNVEFVKELMEFSETGALMQVFIIEAIRFYAENTLEWKGEWKNGFISQEAWNRCATLVIEALEKRK